MKYYKSLFFILVCIFINNKIYSQYLEDDPTPAQRIFFGGNLGLSFGTVNYVEISPLVGYRITDRLSAGVGLNYTYVSSNYYDYNGYAYGGSVFASYTIVKNLSEFIPINSNAGILLYGENSILNVEQYYKLEGVKWINTPLLGVAFQVPISQRSYAMFMVLFNFNETRYSQYSNPVIRISFNF